MDDTRPKCWFSDKIVDGRDLNADDIEYLLTRFDLELVDSFPEEFLIDDSKRSGFYFLTNPDEWRSNPKDSTTQGFDCTKFSNNLKTDSISSFKGAKKHFRNSSSGNHYLVRTTTHQCFGINATRFTKVLPFQVEKENKKTGKMSAKNLWHDADSTELILLSKEHTYLSVNLLNEDEITVEQEGGASSNDTEGTNKECLTSSPSELLPSSPESVGSNLSNPLSSPPDMDNIYKRPRDDPVELLSEKFDLLNNKLDNHVRDTDSRFASTDERIQKNEKRIDVVESRLDNDIKYNILNVLNSSNSNNGMSALDVRRVINPAHDKAYYNSNLYQLQREGSVDMTPGTPPRWSITQSGRNALKAWLEEE
eukprot:TRINITY_DN3002_c0_g1_i1.p1 TRINITY_DN3002_c0_g1~~TRINITY_DN3002_c0_g1_i1.p1  ORF type:complete len:365 (-),score=104.55 TRINITY_DN3002_c0_g1_i1:32-1126(-)